MLMCNDCNLLDESVVFDEDNGCAMCPGCLYEIELLDWADEVMEEFGWLLPQDEITHESTDQDSF